jgi:diadenosine tetraphosphatase ApaH/serine/threonine PP2A family protein phosphatase
MWSDPEDVDVWAVSPRGAGWLFGGKVTNEVILIVYLYILILISFNSLIT